MNRVDEFKKRFDAEVNESHISYSWDAGWCYSGIEQQPVFADAEAALSPEEYDEFYCYTNDWLHTHDGMLYHMSDVVDGKLVNQAEELEGDEAIEYAKGLIGYIEKYEPTCYKEELANLKKFISK